MDYAVRLSNIYNTVLVVLRSPAEVLAVIDALQEIGRVKLSRCVHEIVPDTKTDQPRTVWAFTTHDSELLPLIEEVLGLAPNPHR